MSDDDRNTKVVKEVGKAKGAQQGVLGGDQDDLRSALEKAAAEAGTARPQPTPAAQPAHAPPPKDAPARPEQGMPATAPAAAAISKADMEETFTAFIREHGAEIVKEVHANALDGHATEAAQDDAERSSRQQHEIDILDEQQIMNELQGRVIQQYFYHIVLRSGGEITGISQAGVKKLAMMMAQQGWSLSVIGKERILGEDTDGPWVGYYVTVRNLATMEDRIGFAAQHVMMYRKDGGRTPDPFADVKALNKAQRNGLRWHEPEAAIVEMYKAWDKLRSGKGAK